MVVGTISEQKYNISHAINNRLNTLTLGMRVLENETSADAKHILESLRLELKDLQHLVEELKYAD
jgi:hypothetical protein